jgi:2-C-methyl-D-erythritol 2,4-cyclodiphosphate synthase
LKIRVGVGFDVHQLVEKHPFILGGVNLEHHVGAFGHSDADVLVHAICDALLGAANLGDIGHHFSNTDARWKGISSLILLQECVKLLAKKGWTIGNIDAMLCLEAPKINPYIPEMKTKIAEASGISSTRNGRQKEKAKTAVLAFFAFLHFHQAPWALPAGVDPWL